MVLFDWDLGMLLPTHFVQSLLANGVLFENEANATVDIANKISEFLNSKEYLEYKSNTVIASIENNWQTEKQKLINLLNDKT